MLNSSTQTVPTAPVSPKVFEQIIRKRGRECPRCHGRHRDTVFKMCQPCRELTAAAHQVWRLDHKARKLCPECVQKKGKVTITCEYHRKYTNDLHRRLYEAKRAKGLCTWGACQEASEGSHCEVHAARSKSYGRKARSRQTVTTRRRWAA